MKVISTGVRWRAKASSLLKTGIGTQASSKMALNMGWVNSKHRLVRDMKAPGSTTNGREMMLSRQRWTGVGMKDLIPLIRSTGRELYTMLMGAALKEFLDMALHTKGHLR